MGSVLIVKNNDVKNKIHSYAQKSLEQGGKRKYYTGVDTLNAENLNQLKEELNNDSKGITLILLISYNTAGSKNIEDMFIGTVDNIGDCNYIEYYMKIQLTQESHERVITSIVDKIDLDMDKDFKEGCYVIKSDMDSLYLELNERIKACNERVQYADGRVEQVELLDCDYRLSPLAQRDYDAIRVYKNDDIAMTRTEFQRDRERVVNCRAFRRLVDKAQIFSAEKGDYYRTRMTHSLEVNQIAKAIAYALRLNLDLTEAIALGHDLGHTPFGHQGERTLDDILSGKQSINMGVSDELLNNRCFGGFKHNYQSARILTELEEHYTEYPGLNVSIQVVEGVLKHTRIKPSEIKLEDFLREEYIQKISIDLNSEMQTCSTLEGQVVGIADEIAQRGHDVDDALTSGVMSIDEFVDRLKISKCKQLQTEIEQEIHTVEESKRLIADINELKISRIVSCIIKYFINTTIDHSKDKIADYLENKNEISGSLLELKVKLVEFSPEVEAVNSYLERVVQKKVICNNDVARADYNANMVVKSLFEKYYSNPRLLHVGTIHKIFLETLRNKNKAVSNSAVNLADGSIKLVNEEIKDITVEPIDANIVMEYLQHGDIKCCDQSIVIFEKRKILVRAIVDFIAGMTDGYALEEYNKLK